MANVQLRRGFGDFVPGAFPEPHNPIWFGVRSNWDFHNGALGDFVPAWFPEPHNPIWPNNGMSGCGSGCRCDDCAGMGAIAVPAFAANLPTFLQGSAMGVPVVYLAGGGLALLGLALAMSGKKGRR